eukprot:Opistho-1_new@62130
MEILELPVRPALQAPVAQAEDVVDLIDSTHRAIDRAKLRHEARHAETLCIGHRRLDLLRVKRMAHEGARGHSVRIDGRAVNVVCVGRAVRKRGASDVFREARVEHGVRLDRLVEHDVLHVDLANRRVQLFVERLEVLLVRVAGIGEKQRILEVVADPRLVPKLKAKDGSAPHECLREHSPVIRHCVRKAIDVVVNCLEGAAGLQRHIEESKVVLETVVDVRNARAVLCELGRVRQRERARPGCGMHGVVGDALSAEARVEDVLVVVDDRVDAARLQSIDDAANCANVRIAVHATRGLHPRPHDPEADDVEAPRGEVVHVSVRQRVVVIERVEGGVIGRHLIHDIDAVEDGRAPRFIHKAIVRRVHVHERQRRVCDGKNAQRRC